jgi:hypothetical protein
VISVRFLRPLLTCFILFSTFAGDRLFAQSTPDKTDNPADREVQANVYIHEVMPYWQHRLQLQDWNISILMSRRDDLRPGTLGNIHWDADNKTATIHVLDVSDYTMPYNDALKDMEFTIVHELIHLELASLPIDDANRTDEEFAINHLTDALLASGR